jgi:ABC-type Fe3+/spermidine/putrescine transport system ATPase subunit
MRDGIIEQLGAPRALYERPRSEFVAGFLGASNFFDARVIAPDTVEIAGQRMKLDGDHDVGAALRIAVRPEKIALHRSPADHGVPARVREIVYRGATTHLYLDSAAGPIIAYEQNTAMETIRWQVGDAVACSWAEGSAVVLGSGA